MKLTRIIPALITLMVIVIIPAFSQSVQFTKEQKQKLADANSQFNYGNYHIALPVYSELYAIDSTNSEINYNLGVCIYYIKREKSEAIKYFEKSKMDFIDAFFYLGNLYHNELDFSKAMEHYLLYKNSSKEKNFTLDEVNYRIEVTNNAGSLMEEPKNVWIQNMGETVNSKYAEYAPVISQDDRTLYFTSRRDGSTGGLLDPYNEYFEDIYYTKKEDGTWSLPLNMGPPINTPGHDATVTLSPDGSELYLFRTDPELTGGDIFISDRNENNWLLPEKINAEINTKQGLEASACLSPDGNTCYFSSNREGGYGGKDLYKVVKLPNGLWSKAQNLGPTVNTPYDEDAPYLDSDGATLYFSSKGHKNMGVYDLLMCTMNENGIWNQPENLGYPINTVNDEIYFVISNSKDLGYFSSNRKGGLGLSDIYAVDMPENWTNYIMVVGELITADSLTILNCTITFIDSKTNKVQGIYRPNKTSGKFVILAMPNKKYKMIVEASGFHNYIGEIEVNQTNFNKILTSIKLEEKQ